MRVRLTDDQEVKVTVHHIENEEVPKLPGVKLRGTRVRLTFPDESMLETRSICKPPDKFHKGLGRKLAANRLMRLLDSKVSKEDRAIIFSVICPEY